MMETTLQGSYPLKPSKEESVSAYYRAVETGEFIDPFLRLAEMYIEDQLRAGIDIISDGSQLRSDMVRIFTSKIAGIRDRGKPVAERKLVRRGPIMVEDVKYARKLIPPYASLKAIITGPYTLAMNCEFVHTAYSDYRELAFDFARILNEELREVILAVPDIVYVQVDEPVFSVDFPDFARELVDLLRDGIDKEFALHVCGDVAPIFDRLVELGFDILDHEFTERPELLDVVADSGFSGKIGYGCVDNKSNRVESVAEIEERIGYAIEKLGKERLIIKPDCGFRYLKRESAFKKMENMVKARNNLLDVPTIAAKRTYLKRKDFDPAGYFYITVDEDKGEIVVRHYNYHHILDRVITGRSALDIANSIINQGLVSETRNGLRHIAYITEELIKAERSLKEGKRYIQDEGIE